jgi:hypothetical protein
MRLPGQRIYRDLSQGSAAAPTHDAQPARIDAPRAVRRTVIDFSSLGVPEDVRLALALAFWGPPWSPVSAQHQVLLDLGVDL